MSEPSQALEPETIPSSVQAFHLSSVSILSSNRDSRLANPEASSLQVVGFIDQELPDQETDKLSQIKNLGILFLLSSFFTLCFTIIPVLAESTNFPASPYPGWYGSNDLIRLIEPLVALPIQALLFKQGMEWVQDKNRSSSMSSSRKVPVILYHILFAFFAAVYQQGAGFHSASNMFKHSIITLLDIPGLVETFPIVTDVYNWMRNDWEHVISHYMYASAGIALSFLYTFLFKDYGQQDGIKDRKTRLIWGISALLYGLIIGAVAIQFLYGSIVALVLILGYGFGGLVMYLYFYERNPLTFGTRIVVQCYILSYLIAFGIVLTWIGVNKGTINASRNAG